MGVLIDIHEVNPHRDWSTAVLYRHHNRLLAFGLTREAHRARVELFYRAKQGEMTMRVIFDRGGAS